MKKSILTAFLIASISCFSQTTLISKMDSIHKEANVLYSLELAAWKGTDLIKENIDLNDFMGTYISYKQENNVICSIISKDGENTIASYIFDPKTGNLLSEATVLRKISAIEKDLISARNSFMEQLMENDHEVMVPNDFSLNFVPIKINQGYKIYIITGSHTINTIPFGNDYLFYLDKDYKIIKNERFHKSFIPTITNYQGNKIVRCMHTHVLENPYISATDICTFKLYAPFNEIDEFSVSSSALEGVFTYKISTDKLEFSKED